MQENSVLSKTSAVFGRRHSEPCFKNFIKIDDVRESCKIGDINNREFCKYL